MISKGHFYNCMPSYKYCDFPERIENYNLAIMDETQIWSCHHKLEAFFSKKELINMSRYYNVQPRDLVFVKEKGKQVNRTCHYFWPHTARKNIGNKINHKMCGAPKGTHWYNNGNKSIRTKICPEGFVPGRLLNKKDINGIF